MSVRINRREFLKKTAVAAASISFVSDARLVRSYAANEKLNIAIIGAGGRGSSNAGDVSSENIVALCDVDEERAAGTFSRFPDARKYHDFRRMFDEMQNQIDAVVVSTPDHTHAVASVMAMKLGKHVFCEKPLTHTVYEARVMRETAAKFKVATQMGNQGTATDGFRRAVELVQAGVIGQVREVHAWVSGGNSAADRPTDTPPIPPHLQWDLWLGPAPYRPYNGAYVPYDWRHWRDFGTGELGDRGCHTMNVACMALKLDLLWRPGYTMKHPSQQLIGVEAESSGLHKETYPGWAIVRYQFPARGNLPPVKLTWYNGGPRPPQDLLMGYAMSSDGCLLIGTKGSLLSPDAANTWSVLLPEKRFAGFQGPPPTLLRSPGHHQEWLQACKGGPPAMSNFNYGGPLTEMVLLGLVALQVGHRIKFDPISCKIVNCSEANRFLHRVYRRGWSL